MLGGWGRWLTPTTCVGWPCRYRTWWRSPAPGFDFRVADKGFVWSYPERRPGRPRVIRTDVAVLFVGDLEEQQALLLGEPDLFFTAPGYESSPW